MLIADDSSNHCSFSELLTDEDGDDGLYFGLDSIADLLGDAPDLSQRRTEEVSVNNAPLGSFGVELQGPFLFTPSCNSKASYSRTGGSNALSGSAGKAFNADCANAELSTQSGSPANSSMSLTDWMLPIPGRNFLYVDRDRVSQDTSFFTRDGNKDTQSETLSCSATFRFPAADSNHVSDTETEKFTCLKNEAELQFNCLRGDAHHRYSSLNQLMQETDANYGNCFDSSANNFRFLESSKHAEASRMDEDIPGSVSNCDYLCSNLQNCMNTEDQFYSGFSSNIFSQSLAFQSPPDVFKKNSVSNEDDLMISVKDGGEQSNQIACLSQGLVFGADVGGVCGAVSEAFVSCHSDVGGPHLCCTGGNLVPSMNGCSPDQTNDRLTLDKTSIQDPHCTVSNMSNKEQVIHVKNETSDQPFASHGTANQSYEFVDNAVSRESVGFTDWLFTGEGSRKSVSGICSSTSSKNHDGYVNDEAKEICHAVKTSCDSVDMIDEIALRNPSTIVDNRCLDIQVSNQPHPPSTSIRKQLVLTNKESENKLIQPRPVGSNLSKLSQEIQNKSLVHEPNVGDDSDISIIEDLSVPASQSLSSCKGKPIVTSQGSTFSGPVNQMLGGTRPKLHDERFVFQVALQDLSQPKSEATPPDGVLAVNLLRHQRIALSWMVNKETASLHCSGGILADDQGLGKTISTIALILKERPPRACDNTAKKNVFETLNLDEDDDCVTELHKPKLDVDSYEVTANPSPIKGGNTFVKAKGRPSAGTLVVCPTSVLRQWSEELHNKVTSKANLSVLVYHGSCRTKDPLELAKYDVVLTTYSIVSMEVPKQPLVDQDDDEIGKNGHAPTMGLSSSRKRKYPPSSNKRSSKGKNAMDGDLLESVARPLAQVGWFRVVLDEAQSIKNHQTQVARACWGLRAKRRWCLSGTPIQNAVDDLYSYFRFLRYDPYAVYKTFCSTIKVPVHRNPRNGYRKLQAVLKTVMLRRTKGTLLDGQPIITLPPKTVELKKVDFTDDERDFYCRLEADSRAQFAEYAAAGTVKQNYVNILLMLLRLRQACDHPLLVGGVDSNSVWRSFGVMAKKHPLEKRVASLAICGICNDPPEDAVCTTCGHVFCYQCISEHLTGDDNQCPFTNCNTRLSVSSVFSRATLRSSLCDQLGQESIPERSGSACVEPPELFSSGCSFGSSKIKAAVEVLKSLSKQQDISSSPSPLKSVNEIGSCPENSSDSLSYGIDRDAQDNSSSDLNRGSSQLVSGMREKAIVFSQWTRMLDLLEACLKTSYIQYRRLDGTMSVSSRDKAVKDFNNLPEVSVIIMSLKAASLGLNMVAACHVLLLDLWWNPTTEDQAIDRAHRIGQTRPVKVLRLTVKDTVEDRILALQQKKREMVASAFGEDETGSRQTHLTVEDLNYLFKM